MPWSETENVIPTTRPNGATCPEAGRVVPGAKLIFVKPVVRPAVAEVFTPSITIAPDKVWTNPEAESPAMSTINAHGYTALMLACVVDTAETIAVEPIDAVDNPPVNVTGYKPIVTVGQGPVKSPTAKLPVARTDRR